MATKFIKTKTVKPQDVEIGASIEIHADSMATFKTYVSNHNKTLREAGMNYKIAFEYAPFIGSFCKAKRSANTELNPA